ncbi:MAG: hypothetical protein OQJ93_02550 [Ignavibacteriaceae bacterium]|jgi:hypothetical protein|nr:hypothetical protein [Ignavibacteriaceae bacterium]MCW9096245.1 hypothetical protein [Ignavibacteriaceae bacterium]
MKKLILIIITGLLLIFTYNCGYTVLNNSAKSAEPKITHTYSEHTLNGLWTKREGHTRGGDAWVVDYYLDFFSDNSYGFSFDGRPNRISGNYFIESDTLMFVTDRNISKYTFSIEGEYLRLNFISLERLDEKSYPPKLERNWRRKY